jgi:hypothetical protein
MPVGGAPTSRGIAFQNAQAVVACVQILESAEFASLTVEGVEDIVDFELLNADGVRLRVCQAKTRQDPYTWAPADIVEMIGRWTALNNAEEAEFAFVTDGSAGPELAGRLQPALRRAQRDALTDDDREYLLSKGLDSADGILARVTIESEQPSADALLDRAADRLLRLLEIGAIGASAERANELINELFRLVSVRAGNEKADGRSITRAELSTVIGVPLDVIDNTRPWDGEVRDEYVEHLQSEPPHPSLVMLEAQEMSLQPSALALVLRQTAEPVDQAVPVPASEVLSLANGAAISGGPGIGKSTTLELLLPEAIARGLCPVLVSVEGYEALGLWVLVRSALERRLTYRLSPTAVRSFFNAADSVLLLDGVGELHLESRESLLSDIQRLQRQHPHLRVIATSRDPSRVRPLGLTSFVLQRLDASRRRQIASQLVDADAEQLVKGIEESVGALAENPLLFVMALSLARSGVSVGGRGELFERFVEGLAGRPGGERVTDLVLALIRDACLSLRSRDLYVADAWNWRQLLAGGLARLAERRLFDAESVTADDALQRAHDGGLLRVLTGSGLVGLTHDLFCDFFAAEAVRLGQRNLPDDLPESMEEAAVFLAERDGLTRDQARAVASNPVAAARCATVKTEPAAYSEEDATELFSQLRDQLGQSVAERIGNARLRAEEIDSRHYVFLVRDEDASEESEVDMAAETALRVLLLPEAPSSIGAAVAVWLAEIRAVFSARPEGTMTAIPREREQLPAALETAFTARRTDIEALLAEGCPGLTERVIRKLGMRGFHATVGPTTTFPMPAAGGEITEHPLRFTFNAPDVAARLSESVDESFIEEPATLTNCERWLHDPQSDAARNAVRDALKDLLPGFGP